MKSIILPFIIVVILIVMFIARVPERLVGKIDMPEVFTFDSGVAGPTVLIIAGVHGNERAGPITLSNMINNNYFKPKRGKVVVVPVANKWGFRNNVRTRKALRNRDINRNFTEQGGKDDVSDFLIELVNNADYILDFHEGWGYYLKDKGSVGSTMTPTIISDKTLANIADKTRDDINKTISIPWKQFSVRRDHSCDIPGTLACYCQNKNKPYMLVETSGQNDIEPLQVRASQITTIIDNVLKETVNRSRMKFVVRDQ